MPSFVCTSTHKRLGRSSMRTVSMPLIFISGDPRIDQRLDALVEMRGHVLGCEPRITLQYRVGDVFVALDHLELLLVRRARLPAYHPGASGHAAEGGHDQLEDRIVRGGRDHLV